MNGHLEGTVALVTGASSGIGEATALALADSGAAVALIARGDRLNKLKDRIAAAGGTAAAFVADVADRRHAETAVQQVVTEFDRLDIVVNNAGLMRIGAAAESDPADWDEMLSVNVQPARAVTPVRVDDDQISLGQAVGVRHVGTQPGDPPRDLVSGGDGK